MDNKSKLILKFFSPFIILIVLFIFFNDSITNFIKTNIAISVIINLIITTLIAGYLKLIFDKSKIKYEIKKQIELKIKTEPIDNRLNEFKNELDRSKEIYLREYEKNITGFNKLLDKRYEIYPIAFSKLLLAFGEMEEWISSELLPSFDEYKEQDIINFLNTYELGEVFKRKFIDKWKANDKNLESFFTEHIYNHFKKLRMKALNYFNVNRIFISKDVEVKIDDIISIYSSIIQDLYYHHSAHNRVNKYDAMEKKLVASQKKIVELKNLMKTELALPNSAILKT